MTFCSAKYTSCWVWGKQRNQTRGNPQAELRISVLQLASTCPSLTSATSGPRVLPGWAVTPHSDQRQSSKTTQRTTGTSWLFTAQTQVIDGCAMSAGEHGVHCEFRVTASLPCPPWSQPLCTPLTCWFCMGAGGNAIQYVNVTLGPSRLSAGLSSRMRRRVRKRAWQKERQLVAGLYLSAVLFHRLLNLSPDCKF